MLEDCRAGKIDMIITKSVTRFARNTVTTLETVRELKLLGIDVYFEKERIHSISGDGELMLSILASYAQEESRSVSENCKWRIRKKFREGKLTTCNMVGLRLVEGQLCIIPEEAEIIRQIFSDYLSGMGSIAIAKKLNAAGVPSKTGKRWRQATIAGILRNEKYAGNMVLQKTFVADHITKKWRINRGELPLYYVADSHPAIVSTEIYAQVQTEITRRNAGTGNRCRSLNAETSSGTYPFTGKIHCGECGARYCRKHAAIGTKYEKIVWICNTFNSLGKSMCASQQIPESILMNKVAEVLGTPVFEPTLFTKEIAKIQVPAHNLLTFVFHDGHTVNVEWQNPSRRESWTEEMRQVARERQQECIRKRQQTNRKEDPS